jgi:hypothetical protein
LPARSALLTGVGPFSIYRGVLVLWTDRYDARVLTWIDELLPYDRELLVAVSAHKGEIEMAWADGRRRGGSSVEIEGDVWTVIQQWDARTGEPCV